MGRFSYGLEGICRLFHPQEPSVRFETADVLAGGGPEAFHRSKELARELLELRGVLLQAEDGVFVEVVSEVPGERLPPGFRDDGALDASQQRVAVLAVEKTRGNALAQAYNDNLVLDYAGISAKEMNASQRALLLDLIEAYVGNMDDGHAKVRMDEVEAHLDETHFAWIGATGADAVFYYRVQSPVILIEFDHQGPVALEGEGPSRLHVHSVARTPNGNDYGKDLLRQHYEAHKNDPTHGHHESSRRLS